MIKWGGKNWRPGSPAKRQPINQSIEELMKPLGEKLHKGNVWQVIMNVPQEVAITPSPTPTNTVTPTPSITPTNTVTPTITSTSTNTPTPSITPTNTVTPTQTTTPTVTPTPSSTPPSPSGTTQANAYLSAVVAAGGTGITPTVSAATRTLFTSLVSNGLYDKIITMYPYIGGVAASCLIEGKLQTAYNMTYNGGWTFNASGATPNGSSGWATNNMFANTGVTLNDNSMWTYIGTNPATIAYHGEIGTNDYNAPNHLFTIIGGNNVAGDTGSFFDNASVNDRVLVSSTVIPTALGFFGNNRTSSTNLNAWNKGVKLGTKSTANGSSLPADKFQFPVDGATALQYGVRRHQFDIIAKGFNDTEAAALSTIINTFQTSLGRNVY
jgi:hypothetical protein